MSALYPGQSPGGSSQASRYSQANYQPSGGDNTNSRQGGRSSDRSASSNRPRKPPLFCTHCQLQGHVKETCYKLHGYPLGYKFNNNRAAGIGNRNNRGMANNVVAEVSNAGFEGKEQSDCTESSSVSLSSLSITSDQLSKLMHLLGDSGGGTTDHIAGLVKSQSRSSFPEL
ncbi:hypothetical protein QQ045_012333 [Rhodiola kirilowii]